MRNIAIFMVFVAAVAVFCAFSVSCVGKDGEAVMKTSDNVGKTLKTFGDNRWFSGNDVALRRQVESFISGATVSNIEGQIIAAISPHAGYQFSGKVAGYTFKAVRDNAATSGVPETVVILGFSHRGSTTGIALMDGDAIQTPLGVAKLDRDAASILTNASARIRLDNRPHEGEHSAENQIPFVQVALPDAKIVVAIIGDHDLKAIDELATALGALALKKRILVVASTDMLHDPDYDLVGRTDRETLKVLASMDIKAVAERWQPSRQVFCGIIPVLTAMKFAEAQGCGQGTVLFYRNNGDDDPSSRGSWVVGYGSAIFSIPGRRKD